MTLPEDMDPVMRRIRALEKEVASLRGRNPLASATLDDDDGNRRINFGRLGDGFGMEVFDDDGRAVFRVDEGGLRHPGLNLPYRQADAVGSVVVDSTDWTLTWETAIGYRAHPAFRWYNSISTAPGATYEARLRIGGQTSGVIVCPPGVQTYCEWNWEPGWDMGGAGYRLVQQQIRRIAGSGVGAAYGPDSLYTSTGADIGATPTGI